MAVKVENSLQETTMIILHIAKLTGKLVSGVNVAVPQHIEAQQSQETVGLLNLNDYRPCGIDNVFIYRKPFALSNLTPPFDKPDIVVFHQIYEPIYISIARALRKAGVPYVVLPHGSLTVQAQKTKRLKKLLGNILFAPFFKKARAIQYLSPSERDRSAFKLPCFIGTNGCTIPERKKESFRGDKLRFVFVGRLDYLIKGLDFLLDAFKALKGTVYESLCELHIYGPDYRGSYAHMENMIAERELDGFVTLHPAVFGEEKEAVLLDADVFVQTSRTEGMPMGILEALSYGLPCLVTTGTTLGDFVHSYDAGWVAELSAESVCECVKKAIEDRALLDQRSVGARRLVTDNFSWDKTSRDSLEAYRKLGNGVK